MKKKILSIIGTIAIIALMVLNTQFTYNANDGSVTLSSLVKKAFADGEGGDPGSCYTDSTLGGQLFDCGNGHQSGERWGILSCAGYGAGECLSGTYYYLYNCDGTMVGSDDVSVSKCE